jgi:mono/diheme cytochrome c family protein
MNNEPMCTKKVKGLLAMTIFIGLLAFPPESRSESGNPDRGYDTYTKFCMVCHGSNGKGDGPVAQSLTPPPANLSAKGVQSKTDVVLLSTIQKGRPGTAMPAWEKDLSQQEILDVLAHLRTFKP